MSGVDASTPEVLPYQLAASRALRAVLAAGERELRADGFVSSSTWDAIDELTDALVEQLPLRPARRV